MASIRVFFVYGWFTALRHGSTTATAGCFKEMSVKAENRLSGLDADGMWCCSGKAGWRVELGLPAAYKAVCSA
jgi:hypothetical protein